ncbi:PE domain-containing protein [Saccharopolyspora aridisoli]|uniref:PE domain-containing protein n=1 Tax=Saccharopolyspora aridisoli TaxID=2530385 RepID=A0A4R4U7B8_9PSEU|nr:PE domain-containing protein [Saccharopolyspora aridisoli]TDC87337.1 PE domain-containing protein [Saccharopolyspora aridisoli]
MFPNVWGQITETVDRIADKQAYAASQSAGGSMQIDPDKVDEIARFFADEADKMEAREVDMMELANVQAPGADPVSTDAAAKYGQVAAGDPRAYMHNYAALTKVFREAAEALSSSARQTRTDDDTAAHGINT